MGMQALFYGRVRQVHFIGIGGVGMSGIAEVLLSLGFVVKGSDLKVSDNTKRLEHLGAYIAIGHHQDNVQGADVVVVSSDISEENPELKAAHEANIPVIPRGQMLAELMRFQHGIAVAGSHGKTTTTSLVATILQEAHYDPTVLIGGRVNQMGANARLGQGKFLVAEADESDGSFMRLSPSMLILTNLDEEHLNYWTGGIEQIKTAFLEFINRLPFFGLLVACMDAEHVRRILPQVTRRMVTYGINHMADYQATDIMQDGLMTCFKVQRKGENLGPVRLPLVGTHNVQNALSALAIADEVGIPFSTARKALENFKGVHRRFSLVGENKGVMVIDDYGHHPTEIRAVLEAARGAFGKQRLIVLFQPHRYTRTRDLMEDFARSFDQADHLIVSDIYPGGEPPIEGVSALRLYEQLKAFGHKHVEHLPTLDEAIPYISARLEPGDVLLTLGAGDVTRVGPSILEILRQ